MKLHDLKAKYPRLIPPDFEFLCFDGWAGILDSYFATVEAALPDGEAYEPRQVKEKFGDLRIHDRMSDNMRLKTSDARDLAQARSYHVCEVCGAPGCLRNRSGYFVVSCDEHADKDGRIAVPFDPPARMIIGSDDGGHRIYDPEVDAFVEYDPAQQTGNENG